MVPLDGFRLWVYSNRFLLAVPSVRNRHARPSHAVLVRVYLQGCVFFKRIFLGWRNGGEYKHFGGYAIWNVQFFCHAINILFSLYRNLHISNKWTCFVNYLGHLCTVRPVFVWEGTSLVLGDFGCDVTLSGTFVYREEKSLRQVAMEEKFLDLNKMGSCKNDM